MKQFWKWLTEEARELIALTGAILIFLYAPALYRLADPTAGGFAMDAGYIQRIVFAIAQFLAFTCAAWLSLAIYFKTIDRHADSGGFRADWQSATPFQRVVVTVAVFFLLLVLLFVSLSLTPI